MSGAARVVFCPTCRTWFGAFNYGEDLGWRVKQHLTPGRPQSMANLCAGSGRSVAEADLRLPRGAGEVCHECGNVWPTPCDRDCPSTTVEP